MHRKLKAVLAVFALLLSASASWAQLTSSQAKDHVGETATICGVVVATKYAADIKGEPTFLNFDEFFPHQVFTVVIWGSDRDRFGAPEDAYRGRKACVTGKIELYKGIPEVIARTPDQLKAQ